MTSNNRSLRIIFILGTLTSLSPFSIDMYLPTFPKIAQSLGTSVSEVAMTLTSYFIGVAAGQLFYGPVMDRFGRKKPLYFGLALYIAASLAAGFSMSIEQLIVFRFVQAVGGCAAGVASFAMVRDLFTPRESAKVLSTLVLILGASPLLAPTVGSTFSLAFGWPSLFYILALMGLILVTVVAVFLPETKPADPDHPLHPVAVLKVYWSILKNPQFFVYTFSGAIGFSGLFVYLAASPTIFMQIFQLSEKQYSIIFALIAGGFIITSQSNSFLLKRFSNEQVYRWAVSGVVAVSSVFTILAYNNALNVVTVVALLFLILSVIGLSNPNSAALSMAPFGATAGSAAALLGFIQMTVGALVTFLVGYLKLEGLLPIAAIFCGASIVSLLILVAGRSKVGHPENMH